MKMMMLSVAGAGRLLAPVSIVALLSACAVKPEPFTADQLARAAKEDRAGMSIPSARRSR